MNIIRDYEVVEKRPVVLSDTLVGLVRCGNPKCITNHEPTPTRVEVVNREDVELRCHYCGHTYKSSDIEIIK